MVYKVNECTACVRNTNRKVTPAAAKTKKALSSNQSNELNRFSININGSLAQVHTFIFWIFGVHACAT